MLIEPAEVCVAEAEVNTGNGFHIASVKFADALLEAVLIAPMFTVLLEGIVAGAV